MSAAASTHATAVVIDTNRVLDVWLFEDAAVAPLRDAIESGAVRWLALHGMRDELARVLGYPNLVRQLARFERDADAVLAAFDRWAQLQPLPPPAPVRCADADDQPFIDLALAARATLLSRDRAVLTLPRRLALLGVRVHDTGHWR